MTLETFVTFWGSFLVNFDEYAVSGSHIIVLSTKTGIMREFIISGIGRAVERLCSQNLYTQVR